MVPKLDLNLLLLPNSLAIIIMAAARATNEPTVLMYAYSPIHNEYLIHEYLSIFRSFYLSVYLTNRNKKMRTKLYYKV